MSGVADHSLQGYADREGPVWLDRKKCAISFQVQQIGKKENPKKMYMPGTKSKVWHNGQVVESTALLEG
jgi:hypothetical protein